MQHNTDQEQCLRIRSTLKTIFDPQVSHKTPLVQKLKTNKPEHPQIC